MTDYEKAVSLWRQKRITNDAELAEALNSNSIAFAYHSGKIENENITYHDTREIFEHDGVTNYTGDLRTLFEIRNAKEANELLQAFATDQETFNKPSCKIVFDLLSASLMDESYYATLEANGYPDKKGMMIDILTHYASDEQNIEAYKESVKDSLMDPKVWIETKSIIYVAINHPEWIISKTIGDINNNPLVKRIRKTIRIVF